MIASPTGAMIVGNNIFQSLYSGIQTPWLNRRAAHKGILSLMARLIISAAMTVTQETKVTADALAHVAELFCTHIYLHAALR